MEFFRCERDKDPGSLFPAFSVLQNHRRHLLCQGGQVSVVWYFAKSRTCNLRPICWSLDPHWSLSFSPITTGRISNKEQGILNYDRKPLHYSTFLVPCSIFETFIVVLLRWHKWKTTTLKYFFHKGLNFVYNFMSQLKLFLIWKYTTTWLDCLQVYCWQ